MAPTTIKLRKNIVELLNSLKVHPRQPYDEIISMLVKNHGTSPVKPVKLTESKITTIKVSKSNVNSLSKLKIHPLQPYEEVVSYLISEYKNENKK